MRTYAWARYHALVTLPHVQPNPFYHPFYPDVTHVRKDIRPSPAFPYWKRRKAERGMGTRLIKPSTRVATMAQTPLVTAAVNRKVDRCNRLC